MVKSYILRGEFMNEVFKKLKAFLLCVGSACTAFLLFVLCGKKLHNNRSTDDRIKEATDGIQGTTDRLRTTTERFKDANGRLEKLIEDIEETGVKKKC